jgi:hypothetical protein
MTLRRLTTLLLLVVGKEVGRGEGSSCAAAKRCCDGKDPSCAVPGDNNSLRQGNTERNQEKMVSAGAAFAMIAMTC